ncbi:hypothetical protein AOT82_1433 [Psychrobacter sp. AntiMn-1]|nr:hypothetical protein AOT82_1433 [Psychrobacter sp. AntiMn-1]
MFNQSVNQYWITDWHKKAQTIFIALGFILSLSRARRCFI